MSGEPPPSPRPPNDALRFEPGDDLTIHTDSGDKFSGVVAWRSTERVHLIGRCGTATLWTSDILCIARHDARKNW